MGHHVKIITALNKTRLEENEEFTAVLFYTVTALLNSDAAVFIHVILAYDLKGLYAFYP